MKLACKLSSKKYYILESQVRFIPFLLLSSSRVSIPAFKLGVVVIGGGPRGCPRMAALFRAGRSFVSSAVSRVKGLKLGGGGDSKTHVQDADAAQARLEDEARSARGAARLEMMRRWCVRRVGGRETKGGTPGAGRKSSLKGKISPPPLPRPSFPQPRPPPTPSNACGETLPSCAVTFC